MTTTAEPTDSPTGRRVSELLAAHDGIEPETAALLSAADRAEHVAAVIRPALDRGQVVVCDRYVLTSLALHGGGRGVDVDRVRSINGWSTGDLLPDLTVVVELPADPTEGLIALTGGNDDVDAAAVAATLADEAEGNPDRYLLCPPGQPQALPAEVLDRLTHLLDARTQLARAGADGVALDGPVPDGPAPDGPAPTTVEEGLTGGIVAADPARPADVPVEPRTPAR